MSAISAEALSKLLSTLYAAPTQPELWTRFLEEFTQLAGLPAEYYDDFLTQFDLERHAVVATVKQPTGLEHVRSNRGLDAAGPPPETLAAIELVAPHLRTALQLRNRLFESDLIGRNYADVIESLRAGVAILNERGDCVFVNRRALEVCAADDGIYIRESRLGAHHPDDHSLLCGLIERANAVATGQSTKPCGTALMRRRFAPPLQVSAVALSPQAPLLELSAAKIATVAVFIRAPDDGVSTLPELLIASYGLTSAEARLGVLLFDGCSLTQAAERNNVSRETVRVQLRSIFSKTHVRRQSDFLRLCWQLVRAP